MLSAVQTPVQDWKSFMLSAEQMHHNPNKGDPIWMRITPLALTGLCDIAVATSGEIVLYYLLVAPLAAQYVHYFWWWVLPGIGIDFGRFIINLFDIFQQVFNVYGALITLWLFLAGDVTIEFEGEEFAAPVRRVTSLVCLANFGYDFYKTNEDMIYQRERWNAERNPEDDPALFSEMYF